MNPTALRRAALLCTMSFLVAGCANRPATPAQQAEDWYRKPNLFASFDAEAADLSLPNAYLLELACYIGDRGTFEVDRTLQTWGFTTRRDFRDIRTSTYGYVASNDAMVLVTFGGTDFMNIRDLLSDMDALQLVYDERYCATPEGRVHRGFRDSLNSVMDGVVAEVQRQAGPPEDGTAGRTPPARRAGDATRQTEEATARESGGAATRPATRPATRAGAAARPGAGRAGGQRIAPPRKKLFVAGHSRGGAFAVLAAAALAKAGTGGIDTIPQLGGVYTFGQPRVGNGPFVEGMESLGVPLFRFIHRDDPIPGVPPAGLLPQRSGAADRTIDRHGYQHGGVAVHLREDGRVVRAASDGPGGAALPDPRAAAAGIGNHYQAGYHGAIYRALANPEVIEESAWRATASGVAASALPRPGG